jgi:hypothetical protein
MERLRPVRLAIGFGLIAIGIAIACLPDDWIESASGWSPDNGNGLAEAALAGAPIALGCILAADAIYSSLRRRIFAPAARLFAQRH